MFKALKSVDHVLVVTNMALLLVVSFVPFPTKLVGEHLLGGDLADRRSAAAAARRHVHRHLDRVPGTVVGDHPTLRTDEAARDPGRGAQQVPPQPVRGSALGDHVRGGAEVPVDQPRPHGRTRLLLPHASRAIRLASMWRFAAERGSSGARFRRSPRASPEVGANLGSDPPHRPAAPDLPAEDRLPADERGANTRGP